MNSELILANWTVVLAIATILTALTTMVLTYFSFRESKRNFKIDRFKVYLDIMHILDSTHMEREEINRIIRDNSESRFNHLDLTKNSESLNNNVELIIRDWDKIGLMWENGIIPNELVYYYSEAIVSSFIYFLELIRSNRLNKRNQNYRKRYERLFYFADKYRHTYKGTERHDDILKLVNN
jgi:hypothetical protein